MSPRGGQEAPSWALHIRLYSPPWPDAIWPFKLASKRNLDSIWPSKLASKRNLDSTWPFKLASKACKTFKKCHTVVKNQGWGFVAVQVLLDCYFAALWASWAAFGCLFGRTWTLLGSTWSLLAASWAQLGRSWSPLRPNLGALARLLGQSWALLAAS